VKFQIEIEAEQLVENKISSVVDLLNGTGWSLDFLTDFKMEPKPVAGLLWVEDSETEELRVDFGEWIIKLPEEIVILSNDSFNKMLKS
jgi:hypothetical protein